MNKPLDKHLQIDEIQMVEARDHYPHKGAFIIRWSSERGFGEYVFHINMDDTISLDTECDGKERVKHALCMLVDKARLED
jgi:hypothetical protein